MSLFKKMAAEFIGTAVLVVFGCGTAMTVGCASEIGGALAALCYNALDAKKK